MATGAVHFGTVVIGAGPAGCAFAGTLAAISDESILLIEAGPDYGPQAAGTWPAELLDASCLASTHSWGYTSGSMYPNRELNWSRARVVGGCSAHNGCAAIWGHRDDYDAWADAGNDGWSTDELLPTFKSVSESMRVRIPADEEIQPGQRHFLEGAVATGIPRVEDLNNLDEPIGVAPSPVNVADGLRWNGAFAFLDPVREQSNVTILSDTLVDRVELRSSRVVGVHAIVNGSHQFIEADCVVLTAGAYGSPAILLRSGIGHPEELKKLGITPQVDLHGVGRNLHDHPAIDIPFSGSEQFAAAMSSFSRERWLPEEQVIAKARSRDCRSAFDLHIYPVAGPSRTIPDTWEFSLNVACMTPKSRGSLTLRSTDVGVAPILDHAYLTDPEAIDLGVLIDGLEMAREIVCSSEGLSFVGDELAPGVETTGRESLGTWIADNVGHYYHPVGTCKMGPESDPEAVTSAQGGVYGVDDVFVADCSIMPVIPRANTNIPAAVIGARVASRLRQTRGI